MVMFLCLVKNMHLWPVCVYLLSVGAFVDSIFSLYTVLSLYTCVLFGPVMASRCNFLIVGMLDFSAVVQHLCTCLLQVSALSFESL